MKSVSLFSLLLGVIAGCSVHVIAQRTTPPEPPTSLKIETAAESADDFLGTLTENRYSNKFFGLELTIPEDYTILNRAEIEVFVDAGVDLMKGDSQRNNKAFAEATANSVALFMVAKLPPGSPGNAVLEIQVRKQAPGVTAKMVLAESTKLMTGTSKSEVTATLKDVQFGGRTFSGIEFETIVAGQKLKQQLLMSIVRGYAFSIGLTYTTPSSMNAFDDVFKSIKFGSK